MADDVGDFSPGDVLEGMEPFGPYTAGELATVLDAPKGRIRALLDRLADSGSVRKKASEPGRSIWIRPASVRECPECGEEFEIRFLHPVLSIVQFCPNRGTQL